MQGAAASTATSCRKRAAHLDGEASGLGNWQPVRAGKVQRHRLGDGLVAVVLGLERSLGRYAEVAGLLSGELG